ncbi:DUF411 domain-containing protein [Granulosicoccus antarcticus]|uniref:Metal-binding protein n=1 Tax=Granulosicoccus antarcticus IMCC3135 TaxID=1192854 RepID=A0A2Z2P1D5_9GAMM|nr:DUF411 domain-containing protein [Granulosicoccus antarcticus]ASJ73374.1 hypothetical protein IMCC3135_16460 [Granulosicoccus antarcticus IMCC3135]
MRLYTRTAAAISLPLTMIVSLATGAVHATEALIYKNPQCGCCENYADYLRANDYEVTVKPTHELSAISRDRGLSDEYQGCHLALIDGYFVSGHVPVTVIDKLLSERPDIDGITLPGMPLGSPGMGGNKSEPWKIFAIDDGNSTLFSTQ